MTGAHALMNKADVVNTLIQSAESNGKENIHVPLCIYWTAENIPILFCDDTGLYPNGRGYAA